MRVALRGEKNGWVVDNIVKDFKKYTKHQIVDLNDNPDIFWCVYLFGFPLVSKKVPPSCISIVHIHHIDEDKIDSYDFKAFNEARACVVYNDRTKAVALKYMDIPIYVLPYWIISDNLKRRDDILCTQLKRELSQNGELLIGSFVKDGNGKHGETPKLSKGPDIFVDVVEKINSIRKVNVVLAGHARKYVIEELSKRNISYVYKEKYEDIQSLYDCLDWYFVTSRVEGGPQSVMEASYRNIKILSTDVGIASEVLHPDCLCDSVDDFVSKFENNVDRREYNYNSVIEKHMPGKIISIWDNFFEECYNRGT